MQSLLHTYRRYRTLKDDVIHALPIAILMPHSSCNCRCVMCDIWKDNKNAKELTLSDVEQLMGSLKKLGTRQVLLSGGEALLHSNFFRLCDILHTQKIHITLLSTGLLLKKHAAALVDSVDDIIVSLDGNEALHNSIRNIPGAFEKLAEGIAALRSIRKGFPVSGRTVIHALNYREWPAIIDTAARIGLDHISFLPADVSSTAFNRETPWDSSRQQEILIPKEQLPVLEEIIEYIIQRYAAEFESHFIAESPDKIRKIYSYYAAQHGLVAFPWKACNAPWVSAVIEADGTVRPCFFHEATGNIHKESLEEAVNGEKALQFRRELDMSRNATCMKCVCSLYLPPFADPRPGN